MKTHHLVAAKRRSVSDESNTPQKRYVENLKPNISEPEYIISEQ